MASSVDVQKLLAKLPPPPPPPLPESSGFPFRFAFPNSDAIFTNLCESSRFIWTANRRKIGKWKYNPKIEKRYPKPQRFHALLDFLTHYNNYSKNNNIPNDKPSENALEHTSPLINLQFRGPSIWWEGSLMIISSDEDSKMHGDALSRQLLTWSRSGCNREQAIEFVKRAYSLYERFPPCSVVKRDSPIETLEVCWWAMIIFCVASIIELPIDVDKMVPSSPKKAASHTFRIRSIQFQEIQQQQQYAPLPHVCTRGFDLVLDQKQNAFVGQFRSKALRDIRPIFVGYQFSCAPEMTQLPHNFHVSCPLSCPSFAAVPLSKSDQLMTHLMQQHNSLGRSNDGKCRMMCIKIKCSDCKQFLFPMRDGMSVIRQHQCVYVPTFSCTNCNMSGSLSLTRHEGLEQYEFFPHDLPARCNLFKKLVVILELSLSPTSSLRLMSLAEAFQNEALMKQVDKRCKEIKQRKSLEKFAFQVIQPLLQGFEGREKKGKKKRKKKEEQKEQKENYDEYCVLSVLASVLSIKMTGLCGIVAFLALGGAPDKYKDHDDKEKIMSWATAVSQEVYIKVLNLNETTRDILGLRLNRSVTVDNAQEQKIWDVLTCQNILKKQ